MRHAVALGRQPDEFAHAIERDRVDVGEVERNLDDVRTRDESPAP